MKRRTFVAASAASLIAMPGLRPVWADPADLKTLEIGAKAPDFQLVGVDDKTYSLKDFASAKVLVLVFTCNHCPTAQAYESRLAALDRDYKGKGVAVVAISPNDDQAVRLDELGYTDVGDGFADMKIRAAERKFAFPYLYDGDTQATAKAYGVLATPQVYVFDAERKLRYVGRFDDTEVAKRRAKGDISEALQGDITDLESPAIKSPDTVNAVKALLAGKPVAVEKTRMFGCSTKWSDKRKDAVASLAKSDAEPVGLESIDDAGVLKLAKNDTDQLLLVNLWASWCGPCVAEMPELVTMHRMYRGRKVKLVTISMDLADKRAEALKVLKDNHVSTSNYLLQTEDRDKFAEALDKDWPGPLPYTLLIAPGGKILYRKVGAIEPIDVKRAIVAVIGRTY